MSDVIVSECGAERLAELAPLWEALQDHHATLEAVPPVRPRADSWARRQRQYSRWLADGSARLFIAEREERAIGYLMLTIGDGPATWGVGDRAAEVETLSVLPGERSTGAGGALMDAAIRAAEAVGASAIGVGVVHSNAAGIRFYERHGFEPFYVQLLRSKG